MTNKLIEKISKIKDDGRVKTLAWIFIIFSLIVVAATILYENLPLFVKYSLWGQDSFYAGLITNMYNSAIDFFVFSIGLYIVMIKHEEQGKIKQYRENIDDTRFWFSEEAAFKNYANIRRLQELGIKSIDISKCALIKTKLKNLDFSKSMAMGAVLDLANFENSKFSETSFRGAFANETSFNKVSFKDSSMEYLKFKNGKMRSSHLDNVSFEKADLKDADFHATQFKNCNFRSASLQGCNMERADLRQSVELTVQQLLTCKSLKYARLDADLEEEIRARRPDLLGKTSTRLTRNKP